MISFFVGGTNKVEGLGLDLQYIPPVLTLPRVAFGRTYEPSNGSPDVLDVLSVVVGSGEFKPI